MRLNIYYTLIILGLGQTLLAQTHEAQTHEAQTHEAQTHEAQTHEAHKAHEEGHMHHRNEIGLAVSPVYSINEKEFAPGLHLHYIRELSESKFGVGLGYERIFDEHTHHTIGIAGSYRPVNQLAIILSPGIAFEGGESSGIKFAMHVEASYEFEIGSFHIGPLFDFAYDPEDYHLSLGLHIGYGF